MKRSGEWRLSSKRDPRWDTGGPGTLLAGHMCAEAEEAIEKLREAYGEPPLDLHYDETKTDRRRGRGMKVRADLPHQAEIIDEVVRAFRTASRAQIRVASGLGKTYIGARVAERLGAKKALVLVPSLDLIAQTAEEWRVAGEFEDVLAVCSDRTISAEDMTVAELSSIVETTVDPERVREFLATPNRCLCVATYNSTDVFFKAWRSKACPSFDLTIFDEAHRCAGAGRAGLYEKALSARFKTEKRLFMTATPRIFSAKGRKKGIEKGFDVISMDDHGTFGNVVCDFSFERARKEGLIAPYQIVVMGVTSKEVDQYLQSRIRSADVRSVVAQIGLMKTMKKYGVRRVVSFHNSIRAAKRFSDGLPDVINGVPADSRPCDSIESYHIAGTMPLVQRAKIIRRLEISEDRVVIANCACLREGVNVPDIDCVLFVDPRRSTIDIIQAIGRALRRKSGKTSTIILPVLVPTYDVSEVREDVREQSAEGTMEAALDSVDFQSVYDVVRAVRSHDESLGAVLDDMRRQSAQKNDEVPDRLADRLILDLDRPGVLPKLDRSLTARIVQETTEDFHERRVLIEAAVAQLGWRRFDSKTVYHGFPVGSWTWTMKRLYRKNLLPRYQVQSLEAIPGWHWDNPKDLFRVLDVREYLHRNGLDADRL